MSIADKSVTIAENEQKIIGKYRSLIDRSVTEITEGELDGLISIDRYAFYQHHSLESIKFPKSVQIIGAHSFEGSTKLSSIEFKGVNIINESAFKDCTNLSSIILPSGISIIQSNSFDNTAYYNNTSNWEDGVLYIGQYLIQAKNSTISQNCEIKDTTKVMAHQAFSDCSNLVSVTIPDGIIRIRNATFFNCINLTSVAIGSGVTIIDSTSFYGCTALTAISIPSGVTSIGSYSLYIGSETNKSTITMLRETPPSIQSTTFNKLWLDKIIVPDGCGDAYKSATNWSTFADYIVEASEVAA